jgi:spoIIIJ-associated protein
MIESPEEEARAWLQTLLQTMGMTARVELVQPPATCHDPQQQWLEIKDDDTRTHELLLERDGEVLDALQYLLNATMHLLDDRKQMYTIELGGRRSRRQEELATMAHEAAEKVRTTSQEFIFSGNLNAAERRQIHLLLSDEADLDTFSRGKEPDRRLVVRLKDGSHSGDGEP